MKNPYTKKLSEGNIGSLGKLIDLKSSTIKKMTETERLRIFIEFIAEEESGEIQASELIRKLCLIEKALASPINGKHLKREDDGRNFQARGDSSHYEVILRNALRHLGTKYEPTLILDKKTLNSLKEIIWH